MNGRRGYAGLISLVIAAAVILLLVTLMFTPGEKTENGKPDIIDAGDEKLPSGSPVELTRKTELKMRLMEMKLAIQTYEAIEGRKPESLEVFRNNPDYSLKKLPEGYTYSYDSVTGGITIVKDGVVICK